MNVIMRKIKRAWGLFKELCSMPADKRALLWSILKSKGGMHNEQFKFSEDGLCTIHNCDFLSDPKFAAAYEAGCSTGSWKGWPLRWRAYTLCWCAEWAHRLEGDFIECGVNKGGNARMLIEYLKWTDNQRAFYLLDTFEGFSAKHLTPEEATNLTHKYSYPSCLDEVKSRFEKYSFVKIIPGAVPDTLSQVKSEKIAFLSIDMNCVEPEIAAAGYFWQKLSPGAIVVLDDYGFSNHLPQKIAFDDFARKHGVSVLSLPTGQGLMMKPIRN